MSGAVLEENRAAPGTLSGTKFAGIIALLMRVDVGNWLGGTLAAFVAAPLAIPAAAVTLVVVREFWARRLPRPLVHRIRLPDSPASQVVDHDSSRLRNPSLRSGAARLWDEPRDHVMVVAAGSRHH